MHLTAPITNISKNSLHDGPGVRTVVYLKGCTLSCRWCHNPETISSRKEILYIPTKCIRCGRCVSICPEHHTISGNDMVFQREGCKRCGKCSEVCPSLALTLCGEDKTAEEVFAEIKKDSHYYKISGGGVTFSGGECLLYPEFVAGLAKMCKESGIHTAIESAFNVGWENIKTVLPCIDLIFADLKIADSEKHRKYTGHTNELIIDNIRKISQIHQNITLRIPIIPGVNDTEKDAEEFAEVIKTFQNGIKEIELLRYNNMAESKYLFSGREYTEFAENRQNDEEMKKLCDALSSKTDIKCFFV